MQIQLEVRSMGEDPIGFSDQQGAVGTVDIHPQAP